MLWKLKAEANANTMTNSTFKKGTMSSKILRNIRTKNEKPSQARKNKISFSHTITVVTDASPQNQTGMAVLPCTRATQLISPRLTIVKSSRTFW